MIRGFFDPERPPHPFVTVAVNIPAATGEEWVSIEFLVDTGASHTCLHPLDSVRRVGISLGRLRDASAWPRAIVTGGVGGAATYFVCEATYGFRHDDGEVETFAGDIWIAELSAGNQRIPSLLGWDLLKHFLMDVDGPAQELTLRRP
ncbi:MAG: hypothetical protein ACKVT1_07280 [Dehalococcoidia bacterium]